MQNFVKRERKKGDFHDENVHKPTFSYNKVFFKFISKCNSILKSENKRNLSFGDNLLILLLYEHLIFYC